MSLEWAFHFMKFSFASRIFPIETIALGDTEELIVRGGRTHPIHQALAVCSRLRPSVDIALA